MKILHEEIVKIFHEEIVKILHEELVNILHEELVNIFHEEIVKQVVEMYPRIIDNEIRDQGATNCEPRRNSFLVVRNLGHQWCKHFLHLANLLIVQSVAHLRDGAPLFLCCVVATQKVD